MRRPLVIVGAVALVLVVAVGTGAYLFWPRGTDPITEKEAVTDFRDRTANETGGGDRAGRPAPGVYVYRATGSEDVKLGPLPSQTRTHPATVTMVIVDDARPGCFTATLNLSAQHTEDTTYCVDGQALRLDRHTKHQQVGALSPTATMTCDPSVLVDEHGNGATLACTLGLSGGPTSLDAKLAGTTTVGHLGTVAVGDEQIAATRVDVSYTISGDLSGTWRESVWFSDAQWLPLRIERDLAIRGLATFSERTTLELTDATPRR